MTKDRLVSLLTARAFELWLFIMCVPGVFFGGLWAVAGIGAGSVALVGGWVVDRRFPRPALAPGAWVVAFLVLLFALYFHVFFPVEARKYSLQVASILIPLVFLSAPSFLARLRQQPLSEVWAWVLAGVCCLLALEIEMGLPLQSWIRHGDLKAPAYNRGFSYAIIAFWPFAALVWQRQGIMWALFFALTFVPGLETTLSRATLMALVAGIGVFGVAWFLPRLAQWGLGTVLAMSALWPFGARWIFASHSDWLSPLADSWRHRVEIWDYMSYRIAENPIWGWGMGASPKLSYDSPHANLFLYAKKAASHPHNFITEFWVELGLPGLALGLAAGFITLCWAARLDRRLSPFALAAWAGCFVLSLCAYNFWTDSFLAMIACVSVLFILVAKDFDIDRKGA